MTDEQIDQAIATFFSEPTSTDPFGTVSTLLLVRREVQDCYVGRIVEPEDKLLTEPSRHRLFATALVVFAGIDLLAKFLSYGRGMRIADGFVEFLTRFARSEGQRIAEPEARMIWAFRNALVHSFGLHHEDKGGRIIPLFIYEQNASAPVVRRVDLRRRDDPSVRLEAWELSLDDLVEMFLLALREYRDALASDETLRTAFGQAFDKFGALHRRGPHITRA